MKIGDVKMGEVYGYRSHSWGTPGPVRALEVVVEEEGGTRYRPARKVRRVRVEFLAAYGTDRWRSHEKGDVEIIEARVLIGPWSDYAANVAEDRKTKAERDAVAAYFSSMLPEVCDVTESSTLRRYIITIDKDHEAVQLDLAKQAGFYTEPEPFGLEVKSS